MKSILIQQIYPDTPGVKLLELTREHHAEYCRKWGIEYKAVIENAAPDVPVEAGNWSRVKLLLDAVYKDYDQVYWLDADTLIVDFDTPLWEAVDEYHIGVCWHRIPQGDHWNIGTMYMGTTQAIKEFVSAWYEQRREPVKQFLEQAVFNDLAMLNKTVVTISDRWNATFDVNMCPDAVVLGFHGQGNTEYRYKLMQEALERFANKKADNGSG